MVESVYGATGPYLGSRPHVQEMLARRRDTLPFFVIDAMTMNVAELRYELDRVRAPVPDSVLLTPLLDHSQEHLPDSLYATELTELETLVKARVPTWAIVRSVRLVVDWTSDLMAAAKFGQLHLPTAGRQVWVSTMTELAEALDGLSSTWPVGQTLERVITGSPVDVTRLVARARELGTGGDVEVVDAGLKDYIETLSFATIPPDTAQRLHEALVACRTC